VSEEKEARERLAAILAADVVGYSRMMRSDDRATLAMLDEYRGVFRQRIEAYGGRIVDMAGDSVLAVFDSATGAVKAASDSQSELAKRNEPLPEDRRMVFRVGVNLGDILEKEDGSVYGDGVNVAARLEALASPGGVNVSGSVFDSVRAKIEVPFAFDGERELKNITDPVAVYHINIGGDKASDEGNRSGSKATRPAGTKAGANKERPTVAVLPFKIISGGEEISSLAEGLHEDLIGGLTKQTAVAVVSSLGADSATAVDLDGADFRLEGSVRAAGERLRLSFRLFDSAGQSQVWSERYERNLDNIFDLEDEISQIVSSTVRIRIKARAFEKLQNIENDALSVPDLLSKAAGYFVSSYSHNEEAEEILRLAMERMPENSMALAMMAFCHHRIFEFSLREMPEDVKEEVFSQVEKALSFGPSNFFARLVAALAYQDLQGDYDAALVHAETSLELNSGFSQAVAMVGIVKCHLGETEQGIEMLRRGIAATPEDPHRFRHFRELALAHFMSGQTDQAVSIIDRLVRQAPDLLRNQLVLAAILWDAGQEDNARRCIESLLRDHADLNQRNMRPVRFTDPRLAERFARGLTKAGLPE
jgi:adenylate cyclase